ncbi:class I poly(R)-hydroxyalkanoic acid synthase [Thioflexithrix psekupsensis]|uniref:Class I poly(R)-hydroxyalkanoic acid synthase n=1 Tax=Thioflexithrix psekupsensis TaxID=1570016 RepID=A0A251X6A5_9GAMM|nr:class I poly(R)-hydroxyalkanoic acid synthase [Thioflexithrix psekupsensis]OUD13276.1 class I poly(R)-hydroxyalkanoic acid synthase [Thioflexithrix psekupsensis]
MANTQPLVPELVDPQVLLTTLQDIFQTSHRVAQHLLSQQAEKMDRLTVETDPLNVQEAFVQLNQKLLANPSQLLQAGLVWWEEYFKLWENIWQRTLQQDVAPLFKPAKSDRRFSHEAWDNVPLFDFIKQFYLMNTLWIQEIVSSVEFEEQHAKNAKKVEFYTRQLLDALAPSNFVATNPEVLYVTIKSGGANLLSGLKNFLADLERGQGQLNIKMTDLAAFQPGKNIAVTAGKVIYQNELMQLIQYTPTTETVHQRPLLIVPPWINKYYILDLRENNSFIKWAVDQGHTVFVISWVNPDERLSDKGFENYLLEGPMAALDAIEWATGIKEVNAVGYCLGGTLLATTLAYMAAKQDQRIVSATFFTTLLDFTHSGELDIFIDDEQLSALEATMNEKGYLDGSKMATTFTLLRANDLIWSFHVNNYLMGKEASAFDLLYWNSDATRMPAKMHSFYLRNMYQKNLLKQPNGITLNGVGIDLSKVKTPAYFVSTQEDHIAPWEGTYQGTQLFDGPVKFVLGGSGHIAGIINPPNKNKYFYLTNPKTKSTKNPETWLKSAKKQEGSWWPDWAEWVREYAGESVPARQPGSAQLPPLEDAPGSYVQVRVIPS